MIGRLSGILVESNPPELLIDINGVGYLCSAPMSTIYHLPPLNQKITLHTHFITREDASILYGFRTKSERSLFQDLIKVNGVGPKAALAILSSLSPEEFSQCVHNNDIASIIKAPGIGKKTAERLIIEMRDKLDLVLTAEMTTNLANPTNLRQDAISALIALGYKPLDASKAVNKLDVESCNTEELIRLALQGLAA